MMMTMMIVVIIIIIIVLLPKNNTQCTQPDRTARSGDERISQEALRLPPKRIK